MDSKNEMTRKQFLVLTFSLVGTTAAMGSCDDDNNNVTGTAGTSGGTAGTSGGTAGTTGTGGGGGTTGTGGGGGTSAAACADPLPAMQAASDHTHTVTIAASTLDATTAQTFTTSTALAHMHMVTLEPAQLTTLKGGGTVMVTSSTASAHTHVFTISCH